MSAHQNAVIELIMTFAVFNSTDNTLLSLLCSMEDLSDMPTHIVKQIIQHLRRLVVSVPVRYTKKSYCCQYC